MFTAIGLYLKSKLFNLKTILISVVGLLVIFKIWWLKFQLTRQLNKIRKFEGYYKTTEHLDKANKQKQQLDKEPKTKLRDRFPKGQ